MYNDNRKLVYKNPLGETKTEQCTCDKGKPTYVPTPLTLYEITTEKNGKRIYYYFKESNIEDKYRYGYGGVAIISANTPFEKINTAYYSAVFIGKEQAQAYCDWLNAKHE